MVNKSKTTISRRWFAREVVVYDEERTNMISAPERIKRQIHMRESDRSWTQVGTSGYFVARAIPNRLKNINIATITSTITI